MENIQSPYQDRLSRYSLLSPLGAHAGCALRASELKAESSKVKAKSKRKCKKPLRRFCFELSAFSYSMGWREALDPGNKKKAVATILQFDRDTPINMITKQLAATRMLMKPSQGIAIGSIDVEAWKQTERIMLEQRLIPDPVSVERILRPYSGFVNRMPDARRQMADTN